MIVLFQAVSPAGGSLLIIQEKEFGVFPPPALYSKPVYAGCILQAPNYCY